MYFASAHFEKQILNTFRNITATGYPYLYIGLFQTSPGENGNAGIEIAYQGYERQLIEFAAPRVSGTEVSIDNESDIVWPNSETAAGEVNFIGIFDKPAGGDMVLYGELSVPLNIGANTQPSILAGDIVYIGQGSFSVAYTQKYLNLLRGQDLAGFVPHWALFTGDPQSGGTEFSGANYSRVPVEYGEVTKTVGEFSRTENTAVATFPPPHDVWGLWTHNALMDAPTGGTLCSIAAETTPVEIRRNYRPRHPIGWSVITMD